MANFKEDERLNKLNHSCAHLLAQAVKHLYPQAKFWVGPVVEEGFYYDIDLDGEVIKEEDLEKIERENIKEVILATNPNIEGETTALYIAKLLENKNVEVTRLAYGLPVGASLDYADEYTLIKSLQGRRKL